MTNKVRCIITGCALICDDGAVWGDLYAAPGMFVFVGNFDPDTGRPRWMTLDDVRPNARTITIIPGAPFLEKRGVFFASADACVLNSIALEYVR